MRGIRRRSLQVAGFVVFSLLVVWSLAGLADTPSPHTSALRVGYSPEPPFSFRTEDGEASGEAPEVARAVLQRAGIGNVEWVQTDFGLLIPELLAGRIDMIAAGMFITDDRARAVRFSRPTLEMGQSLLVRKGNPRNIHRYEDFAARPDLKLGVLQGAVERSAAVALGVPEERILAAPDAQTGLVALASDAVDGLALSGPSIRSLGLAVSRAQVEVAAPFYEPMVNGRPMRSWSAFGFRPSDKALRDRVDAQLEEFIGSSAHLALIARFGFGPGDLPGRAAGRP